MDMDWTKGQVIFRGGKSMLPDRFAGVIDCALPGSLFEACETGSFAGFHLGQCNQEGPHSCTSHKVRLP